MKREKGTSSDLRHRSPRQARKARRDPPFSFIRSGLSPVKRLRRRPRDFRGNARAECGFVGPDSAISARVEWPVTQLSRS